jgi:hypothetical protein
MTSAQFDEIVELALQLSPVEQARLMERLAAAVQDALSTDDEEEAQWTDSEIAELMQVEPMTGAEIVAAGLIGGWEDLHISDGAEWVNEQKRKRREQRRW